MRLQLEHEVTPTWAERAGSLDRQREAMPTSVALAAPPAPPTWGHEQKEQALNYPMDNSPSRERQKRTEKPLESPSGLWAKQIKGEEGCFPKRYLVPGSVMS